MNPFRTPQSGRERLSVLAERLILAMAAAKVELPPEATPEALWTLGIAVAGWWLRGRQSDADREVAPFAALPLLFEVFGGVKALPMFAATAANATDYVQLADGGRRFVEVVNELGATKLKAALGNAVFSRLKAQIVSAFPAPADLAETISPSPKAVPSVRAASEGRPAQAATGLAVSEAKAVVPKAPPPTAALRKVSAETLAFLKERYPDDVVERILKG
jgi:hypothetical protein